MSLRALGVDYDAADTDMRTRWIAWWLERERQGVNRGG